MKDLNEYHRPLTVEEAVRIKGEYGSKAVYMGGSTDLMVHRPSGVEHAIDIRWCGIDYVRAETGATAIGGGCLLRDAERGVSHIAGGMLRTAVRETAPWLIRNAATLAGNTSNASPAADSVPALMALDASLYVAGERSDVIAIEDALVGPHQTNLGDRLIVEIRVPDSATAKRAHFIKLARSASDIALVNVAISFDLDGTVMRNVRVALGAVAPTAIRARGAEAGLEGQVASEDTLREAGRLVEQDVRPISDWRASEAYRRRMSGVLVRRAFEHALGVNGNGAEG